MNLGSAGLTACATVGSGGGQAGAGGAEVDVGAGGFAGEGLAKGEKRDAMEGEIADEPLAFGLIGIKGYIDAAAVIEAHFAVDFGLAHGGNGQRLGELGLEGGIGALTFEVLRPLVDRVALLSEDEILEGMRWMLASHQ